MHLSRVNRFRVCAGLSRGSAAALASYGMERIIFPNTQTTRLRRMDQAFLDSSLFSTHRQRVYETFHSAIENDARLLGFVRGEDCLISSTEGSFDKVRATPEAIQAQALGMTALDLSCAQGFPAALVAYPENVPLFKFVTVAREDGTTLPRKWGLHDFSGDSSLSHNNSEHISYALH